MTAIVPDMWLSAFVSTFLLQVLETSPCKGGAAEISNFSLHSLHFYLSLTSNALSFVACIGGRPTMSEGRQDRTACYAHLDRRQDRKLGRPNPRRHRTLDSHRELPLELFLCIKLVDLE